MNLWMPAKEGRDFEFTPILEPLERFREYLTLVTMMDCQQADPKTAEEVGADHFRSSAVFLTAAHPKQRLTIGLLRWAPATASPTMRMVPR